MNRLRPHALALVLFGALASGVAFPAVAEAHGPVAPVASSYLARVSAVPPGLEAKVVDGDLRMWLRAAPTETVEVIDYRGAPYLRFSASGVDVNQNSAMYYLNQTPVAQKPPSSLTRATPPRWQRVTSAHDYGWHDGRLHALAAVALSPGAAYVGRWSIPLLVDGGRNAISGGLWHADNPSIVWFWPLVVLLACVLAEWRLRRRALDALVARATAIVALLAIAACGVGQELQGRPDVSTFQLIALGIILALVGLGLLRVLSGRARHIAMFAIAFAAVFEGFAQFPTLLQGFVLLAVPAFVARAATVLCLGCGAALMLLTFRLAAQGEARSSPSRAPDIVQIDAHGY